MALKLSSVVADIVPHFKQISGSQGVDDEGVTMGHPSRKYAEGLRSTWLFPKAGDIVLARITTQMEGIGWRAVEQTWRSASQMALFDHDRLTWSPVLLFATDNDDDDDDDSGRVRQTSQPLPVQPVVCCLFVCVWLATG